MELKTATRIMFERYLGIMRDVGDNSDDISHLIWMCDTANTYMDVWPDDKLNRWLGFVQGCLVMKGIVTVAEERDFSRPIFHAVYKKSGIELPATL